MPVVIFKRDPSPRWKDQGAAEIQTRLDMEGNELPERIRDFRREPRAQYKPANSTFGVMQRIVRSSNRTSESDATDTDLRLVTRRLILRAKDERELLL